MDWDEIDEQLESIDPEFRNPRFDALKHVVTVLSSDRAEEGLENLRAQSKTVDDLIQRVVDHTYDGFNRSIRHQARILALFQDARERAQVLRASTESARERLSLRGCSRALAAASARQGRAEALIRLLADAQAAAGAPQALQRAAAGGRWLEAAEALQAAARRLTRVELARVGALQEVREAVVAQRPRVLEGLVEDLLSKAFSPEGLATDSQDLPAARATTPDLDRRAARRRASQAGFSASGLDLSSPLAAVAESPSGALKASPLLARARAQHRRRNSSARAGALLGLDVGRDEGLLGGDQGHLLGAGAGGPDLIAPARALASLGSLGAALEALPARAGAEAARALLRALEREAHGGGGGGSSAPRPLATAPSSGDLARLVGALGPGARLRPSSAAPLPRRRSLSLSLAQADPPHAALPVPAAPLPKSRSDVFALRQRAGPGGAHKPPFSPQAARGHARAASSDGLGAAGTGGSALGEPSRASRRAGAVVEVLAAELWPVYAAALRLAALLARSTPVAPSPALALLLSQPAPRVEELGRAALIRAAAQVWGAVQDALCAVLCAYLEPSRQGGQWSRQVQGGGGGGRPTPGPATLQHQPTGVAPAISFSLAHELESEDAQGLVSLRSLSSFRLDRGSRPGEPSVDPASASPPAPPHASSDALSALACRTLDGFRPGPLLLPALCPRLLRLAEAGEAALEHALAEWDNAEILGGANALPNPPSPPLSPPPPPAPLRRLLDDSLGQDFLAAVYTHVRSSSEAALRDPGALAPPPLVGQGAREAEDAPARMVPALRAARELALQVQDWAAALPALAPQLVGVLENLLGRVLQAVARAAQAAAQHPELALALAAARRAPLVAAMAAEPAAALLGGPAAFGAPGAGGGKEAVEALAGVALAAGFAGGGETAARAARTRMLGAGGEEGEKKGKKSSTVPDATSLAVVDLPLFSLSLPPLSEVGALAALAASLESLALSLGAEAGTSAAPDLASPAKPPSAPPALEDNQLGRALSGAQAALSGAVAPVRQALFGDAGGPKPAQARLPLPRPSPGHVRSLSGAPGEPSLPRAAAALADRCRALAGLLLRALRVAASRGAARGARALALRALPGAAADPDGEAAALARALLHVDDEAALWLGGARRRYLLGACAASAAQAAMEAAEGGASRAGAAPGSGPPALLVQPHGAVALAHALSTLHTGLAARPAALSAQEAARGLDAARHWAMLFTYSCDGLLATAARGPARFQPERWRALLEAQVVGRAPASAEQRAKLERILAGVGKA